MAYPETKTYLSKVQLGDGLYYIKDSEAKAVIDSLKAAAFKDVASEVSSEDSGLVTGAQVAAAIANLAGAMHFIGVKTELPATANDGDVVMIGTKEYVYAGGKWNEIGDEGIYALKSTTVAGYPLSANITVDNLKTALGLGALAYKDSASGTVEGQTISGVKATGTSTGSIAVVLDQNEAAATLTKGDYTPEGSVSGTTTAAGTVSLAASEADGAFQVTGSVAAPTITVTPATTSIQTINSVGTQASFTEGAFSQGSLPTYTQGSKAAWSAEVESETLSFSFTANGDDTFTQGTLPTKAADIFVANDLPTKSDAFTVATGIASASATAPVFTGGKVAATFAGTEADITATFAGTKAAQALVTEVKYNQASVNAAGTKFTGAAITLDVGDIAVAAKDVTVE